MKFGYTERYTTSFSFKGQSNNLGLLENIDYGDTLPSNHTVLFAGNIEEKSTIGRVSRLVETQDCSKACSLITLKKDSADFSLTITKYGSPTLTAQTTISINKSDSTKTSAKSAKYLFHVFNSDCIEENLRQHNYLFDESIEGYTLGKNINFSEQEASLIAIKSEMQKSGFSIVSKIDKVKTKLKEHSVRANTNEYQEMSLE